MRVWAEAANHSWAGKSQRTHTQVITIVRLVIHDDENGVGDDTDFLQVDKPTVLPIPAVQLQP